MERRNDAQAVIRKCRGCGADIMIIRTGTVYGRIIVDADPVWIALEPGGEPFVMADGRVVYGRIAGDAYDDPDANLIPAYVPHKSTCPNGGKKSRQRRRPSGYR